MNLVFRKIPFLNLVRKPGRTIFLVFLTALLSLSVFGGALVESSLRQGLAGLESRLGADIILVPSSAQSKVSFENMLLQGTSGAFYMKKENLDRVWEVEGVEKAAAQTFLASLKADCCSVKIQIIGFDPDTDFFVQPWIEESYGNTLQKYDVVVGSKVGTQVGQTLRIYDVPCPVKSRLAATGTGLDTAVYCGMDTMKELLQAAEDKGVSHKITSEDDDLISAVYIKVKEGYDIGKVNSAVQGHTRKASAIRTRSMITDVSGSLSGIAVTIRVLVAIVWGLSLVILLLTFAMMEGERKKEYALLRLMGTSRRRLARVAFLESLWISLAGGMLGTALAAVLVLPFTTLIETFLGLPYLTPSFPRILGLCLLAIFLSVAVGSLASSFTVRRLSRIDPGATLRSA